jgi:hypothetical protein
MSSNAYNKISLGRQAFLQLLQEDNAPSDRTNIHHRKPRDFHQPKPPMSEYVFNEGCIDLDLDRFTDRTANILILGHPETSGFNLTISRDRLEAGEDLPAYVTRQIALMAKTIKGHKVLRRGACVLGAGEPALAGEFIDATQPNAGKTYFQRQAAFALNEPFRGRVLVFSATQNRPFDAEFETRWAELLVSFRPRA